MSNGTRKRAQRAVAALYERRASGVMRATVTDHRYNKSIYEMASEHMAMHKGAALKKLGKNNRSFKKRSARPKKK